MEENIGYLFPPDELVQRIDGFGFEMFVGDDGVVHGKPRKPGVKVPIEMRPLLDQLRMQNDAVAEILRNRDRVKLDGVTKEAAAPWLDKVKSGEYRLVPGTRVTYEKSTGLTYMELERVKSDA